MALLQCPECGHEVSDRANICMNCGFPMDDVIEADAFDKYAVENVATQPKSKVQEIIDSIEMGNIEHISYSEIFNELFDDSKIYSIKTSIEKEILDEWCKRENKNNIEEAVDITKLNEFRKIIIWITKSFNMYKQREKLYSCVFEDCTNFAQKLYCLNNDEKNMIGLIMWGCVFSIMETRGVDDLGAASIWIEKKICEMNPHNFDESDKEELYQLVTRIIPIVINESKIKFERDFSEARENDPMQCYYYAVNIINLLGNSALTSKIKNEIKPNSNLAKRLIKEGIDENYYFELNIKKISSKIKEIVFDGEYDEYLIMCEDRILKENCNTLNKGNTISLGRGMPDGFVAFAIKVLLVAGICIFMSEILN